MANKIKMRACVTDVTYTKADFEAYYKVYSKKLNKYFNQKIKIEDAYRTIRKAKCKIEKIKNGD